ncbi:MAG: type 4a pilus biogenesis protein PilO [Opitutales bacterium]
MAHPTFTAIWDYIRRYPVGALSLGLCVPLGATIFLFRLQLIEEERRYDELNETGQAMAESVAGVRNVRVQSAIVRSAVEQIDAGLIDENNLAENLWYFYRIEEQTQARISELHQLNSAPPKPDASYKVVPFSLRIAGSYEQVANYLYRLETGPRLLRVSTFSIQRQDAAGNSLMLAVNLDLLARP